VAAGVEDVAAQQAAAAAHARVAHPELLDGQADGAAGVGVRQPRPLPLAQRGRERRLARHGGAREHELEAVAPGRLLAAAVEVAQVAEQRGDVVDVVAEQLVLLAQARVVVDG
jgi:hypothetical protein